MGDIDDDDVCAGAQQLVGALEVVAFGANRRAHPQAAVVVARGEGQPLLLQQVRGRDQTDQPPLAIDERQFLDLVRAHHVFRAGDVGEPFADHESLARCHALGNRAGPFDEAEIAGGEEAEQAPAGVGDHQRAHAGATHGVPRLGERRIGANRVRVGNDAVLAPLDALDLANLRLDVARAEAPVDDPDAAFFGDRDGHLRACDRVHVGGHDRPLQREVLGETRREIDRRRIAPLDDAVLRSKQEVVKRTAADSLQEVGHAVRILRNSKRKTRNSNNDCAFSRRTHVQSMFAVLRFAS